MLLSSKYLLVRRNGLERNLIYSCTSPQFSLRWFNNKFHRFGIENEIKNNFDEIGESFKSCSKFSERNLFCTSSSVSSALKQYKPEVELFLTRLLCVITEKEHI